jgi:glycosyltransferase involved in cell wall biosynthesis
MEVSVVVPTYNEEEYIAKCLKSLLNQTDKPDRIIVVDNNSTDKTVKIIKQFPEIVLLHENHQGTIFARNTGFNFATGDIIARTDADTQVPKDWIKKIKENFKKDENVIAISGPARFYGTPPNVPVACYPITIVYKSFKRLMKHDGLFGPNMAIRKSAWEKIKNELCTDDKMVHEDLDISIHIAKLGKILFDTDLVVDSSARRWKKLSPYFEYPYRYLKTINKHKRLLNLPQQKVKLKKLLKKPLSFLDH